MSGALTPLACIVTSSASRNATAMVLYPRKPKPGQKQSDRFVAESGINGCIPEVAHHQMRQNRKRWGKNGERTVLTQWGTDKDGNPLYKPVTEGEYVQAYHVVLSFAKAGRGALDPRDSADQETAHERGEGLARLLAGTERMATVTTQIDGVTGCLHCHIVVDSIDRQTGRSFDSSVAKHKELARAHDALLEEAGYEQVNELKSTAARRHEKSEARAYHRYLQWDARGRRGTEPFSVAVMKNRIANVLEREDYVDRQGLREAMLDYGLWLDFHGEGGRIAEPEDDDVRGLTFEAVLTDRAVPYARPKAAPGIASHRRRASKLGTKYDLEAVDAAIERNRELARQREAARAQEQAAQQAAQAALAAQETAVEDVQDESQDAPLAPLPADPVGTRSAPAAEPRRPSFEELLARRQAEIDARRAELAALRGEAAPEPTAEAQAEPASTPTPALAPLPPEPADLARSAPAAAEDEAYVSPVRDVDVRSRDVAFRDRVAVLDEHVVGVRREGGEVYDPTVLEGMTAAKVRSYAAALAAETVEVLGWRDAMTSRATRARMAGETYEAQRLREQVRQGRIYDPGPAAPARRARDEAVSGRQDDGPVLGG